MNIFSLFFIIRLMDLFCMQRLESLEHQMKGSQINFYKYISVLHVHGMFKYIKYSGFHLFPVFEQCLV